MIIIFVFDQKIKNGQKMHYHLWPKMKNKTKKVAEQWFDSIRLQKLPDTRLLYSSRYHQSVDKIIINWEKSLKNENFNVVDAFVCFMFKYLCLLLQSWLSVKSILIYHRSIVSWGSVSVSKVHLISCEDCMQETATCQHSLPDRQRRSYQQQIRLDHSVVT